MSNQIPELLFGHCLDILPQIGLKLKQVVLLLLEDIVTETASEGVNTLLGQISFLPFGIDHKVDMRVVGSVMKGGVPL